MNIFRVNRLPLFQGPDIAPAADPAVDPAVVANVDPANPPAAPEPVADPAPQPDPAPLAADPAPQPSDDPQAHGNKGKKPWFLDRISELTHRAQTAEELVERLRTNGSSDPATPPPAPAGDDAEVERRVQARLAQQQISSVITEGVRKYNDWDDRAAILGAAGAASPDFVMDVIGVHPTNAHEILHQLSEDPDKAKRLARLDQRSRIIELARMGIPAVAAPVADPKPAAPPKAPSKAPAPPPQIEPVSSQTVDWRSDKVSDSDFSKGWEKNQKERAARGRR